ncbi:MAG: TrmB family transcriptional regulator [Desulfurococcales archaeon]|nr:TrmB family transcriptional regulator [Desulfurococcales archaeon]
MDFLEFVGIKGYEGKAYLALLELGEATAPQIASRAKIPQPRVYDVLYSLIKKGLIEVKANRPKLYRTLPPKMVFSHYIKSYVEKIMQASSSLIEELSEFYKSAYHEKEPIIWLSYSTEMGIERAKSLIYSMEIDGFMSVDLRIFDAVSTSIIKKFSRNNEVLLAITVIEDPYKAKNIDTIMSIDNIEIRFLPTGIIKLLETDLKNTIIFGDNYTIMSGEWEITLIVNKIYYFGYWRLGTRIKNIPIKEGKRIKTCHHWLAVDIIQDILKEGFNVYVLVKGNSIKDRKPIKLEGYVKSIKKVKAMESEQYSLRQKTGLNIVLAGWELL